MIRSHQNPLFKETLRLRKSSATRRKSGRFLVDGDKEISAAIEHGFDIERLFYSSECGRLGTVSRDLGEESILETEVSAELLSRLSYGQRGDCPVAVGRVPAFELDSVALNSTSLVLVLDRTEKPGNIGACLRTAAACGVDAVLLSDPICEVLNPNVIRASRGAVFQIPIAVATSELIQDFLNRCQMPCFCARVDGQDCLWDISFQAAGAFVFGNEATGLGENWQDLPSFAIPTVDTVDSLNLSISTAVTFYEAMRQRTSTPSRG